MPVRLLLAAAPLPRKSRIAEGRAASQTRKMGNFYRGMTLTCIEVAARSPAERQFSLHVFAQDATSRHREPGSELAIRRAETPFLFRRGRHHRPRCGITAQLQLLCPDPK